jgi:hypothetical protein
MRTSILPSFLLALVGAFHADGVQAQSMTLANGTMTVQAGSRITMAGPLQWTLAPGATLVNDGTIDLGAATFDEQVNAPVTGTGTETATHVHAGSTFNVEPGGLGLALSGDAPADTLIVTRGHSVQTVNGTITSVARWYRYSAASGTPGDVAATLFVDPTELNGIAANELELYRAADLSGPWTALPGPNDPPNFTVSGNFTSADLYLSAFAQDIMTAVPSETPANPLKVWPTISDQQVHVTLDTATDLRQIAVIAPSGQQMLLAFTGRTLHGFSLDVSHYASGVYVLRVNGQFTQRFVRP